MLGALLEKQRVDSAEQLLKLYWNRAGVKRELKALRRERFELLDKLKEQEGAIVRAQEQLEGLERLLINPLAAANAMVYFQLRHLWRIGAQRLEQFGKELQLQREKRERAALHEAETAKRTRRLDAIDEKSRGLGDKLTGVVDEIARLEQQLAKMNKLIRFFRGPQIKARLVGLANGRQMLEEKLEELKELAEKIQGEPLPEPEELSLESRRLINTAVIALAQDLVVHFSEHDLASLSKTATERAVGDMKFGDRRDCDQPYRVVVSGAQTPQMRPTHAGPPTSKGACGIADIVPSPDRRGHGAGRPPARGKPTNDLRLTTLSRLIVHAPRRGNAT